MEQDAQLVQHCLQGDNSAWEELVRRHSRRIFNICYRFTGNRTEAEDLSQDVFLRVYRTLASYRSAYGGFATWMTSVTRNLLIKMIKDELNVPVIERSIDRTELYTCDELFLCGTGAQISPVIEVDRRPIGNGSVGEFTQELQNIYFGAVRGDTPKYKDWTIPVY